MIDTNTPKTPVTAPSTPRIPTGVKAGGRWQLGGLADGFAPPPPPTTQP